MQKSCHKFLTESEKFVQLCQSYAVIVISVILISFYVFLISGHYD